MINPKYLNNTQSYDCTDNSFTQKKEEKPHSSESLIEPNSQPIVCKSGISNKK